MIDGDRKPERLGCAANLHRVDADDLALAIQQRTAAVAGIDGRIGLQHHRSIGTPDGADDAARHAVLKHAEREADGNHFLSGPHVVDRAERQAPPATAARCRRERSRGRTLTDAVSTRPGRACPFDSRTVTDTLS